MPYRFPSNRTGKDIHVGLAAKVVVTEICWVCRLGSYDREVCVYVRVHVCVVCMCSEFPQGLQFILGQDSILSWPVGQVLFLLDLSFPL